MRELTVEEYFGFDDIDTKKKRKKIKSIDILMAIVGSSIIICGILLLYYAIGGG